MLINASLWATQALMALTFGRAAALLLTEPASVVAANLGAWVPAPFSSNTHPLGVIVAMGAFGVIAPSLVRIAPKLAVLSAGGLALALAIAAVVHGSQAALKPLGLDIVLVSMLLFIAWGRAFKSPIQAHAHIRC
jgi:hypothetical protein